jgi:hypothetical protein
MASLLPRDQAALAFNGPGYEVARYQLRVAIFPGLSEVVSSRRVRRWITDGLVAVERFQGFGIDRLRLTDAGRDAGVASGAAPEQQLFVPTSGAAVHPVHGTRWEKPPRWMSRDFANSTTGSRWEYGFVGREKRARIGFGPSAVRAITPAGAPAASVHRSRFTISFL